MASMLKPLPHLASMEKLQSMSTAMTSAAPSTLITAWPRPSVRRRRNICPVQSVSSLEIWRSWPLERLTLDLPILDQSGTDRLRLFAHGSVRLNQSIVFFHEPDLLG